MRRVHPAAATLLTCWESSERLSAAESNQNISEMKPKKSTHPLAARVKKMMQADDDIGKIAQATPVLVGERGLL